jgi:hypothetical protein
MMAGLANLSPPPPCQPRKARGEVTVDISLEDTATKNNVFYQIRHIKCKKRFGYPITTNILGLENRD